MKAAALRKLADRTADLGDRLWCARDRHGEPVVWGGHVGVIGSRCSKPQS
jgi:hypothetical protein